MWPYVGVFFAALAVDLVPVFAPPAWTIIVLLVIKLDIDPYVASVVGAAGSTIGRWALARYMPLLTKRFFSSHEEGNIAFLGRKLGGRFWPKFAFVFLYCLTPLSTTALFTAAGVAKVNVLPILPAFFIGKAIGDLVYVLSSRNAIRSVKDILEGQGSPKGIAMTLLAVLLLGGLLFVDWRALLQQRKLRFEWRILRNR